jgi:hypothetical protein
MIDDNLARALAAFLDEDRACGTLATASWRARARLAGVLVPRADRATGGG